MKGRPGDKSWGFVFPLLVAILSLSFYQLLVSADFTFQLL